jgi:hypothetical protein
MIGIFTKSPDEVFLKHLKLPFKLLDVGSNADKIDGLFLDWVPPSFEKDFIYQAQLVEDNIKKIPIVIFDRHFSVTFQEASYMKKYKTFLFEPALLTGRSEFVYLPEWTSFYSVLDNDEREYNVVDISKNLEYRIESFEKWYKEYARLFPDKKVAYYTRNLKDFKKEEYKKNNLIFIEGKVLPDYTCASFTIINGSSNVYDIGYLDPVYFIAMNQGCIPLLPDEHRFFHSIFKNLIIKDIEEMDYYVSLYHRARVPIIEEMFDRIKKYFPEFTVEYASDIVRKCYE